MDLPHFLSHRNTPRDEVRAICLSVHSLLPYMILDMDDVCASVRRSIKALTNLKEVSILVEDDESWMKQEYSMAQMKRFKQLFGFDSEGVVLITPQLPEESTEEPNVDDSG